MLLCALGAREIGNVRLKLCMVSTIIIPNRMNLFKQITTIDYKHEKSVMTVKVSGLILVSVFLIHY